MERRHATQLGLLSAWTLMVGVLLSGPLTVLLVSRVVPRLQLLTFGFGFLIVLGALGLLTSLHVLADPSRRVFSLLALVMGAVFASIISTNDMFQLAVLRANVAAGQLDGMQLFAFNNPDSVAMALEMLGYGFLGLSTWALAPLFGRRGLDGWIRWLGIANGVVSVLGTALQATVGLRGIGGLVCYAAWNVLFAALSALYVVHARRQHQRLQAPAAAQRPVAWAW